jgi:PST family polysaccharide transporter
MVPLHSRFRVDDDLKMDAANPQAGVSVRKSLSFVYAAYAFRYLYLLVLVPFYGRVLGSAEYGRVLAAMSLYQMVWMLAEYGFPAVGMRDAAMARTAQGLAEVYGRHTSGRLITSAVGLVTGAIGTLASPLLRERPVFGILATLAGMTTAHNLGWFFTGTLQFGTSVLVEIFSFTLNLALVLLLVRGNQDGWLVLASVLASSLAATAFAHGVALRSVDRSSLRWSGGFTLLRESTALFAARSLSILTSSSSTFLVSLLAGANQVGWYGAAERLATAGLSLMQPANQVMSGTVAARLAAKETEAQAFALIRRGLIGLTALGVLMFLGTLALAGVAVPLILGPDFGPSVAMLRILGVLFPFAAFAQVVTCYVLVPLRRDRLVTVVSLVGAVTTVTLTVGLGWWFAGEGVAWARSLGYVPMCLALVHVLRREGLLGAPVRDSFARGIRGDEDAQRVAAAALRGAR